MRLSIRSDIVIDRSPAEVFRFLAVDHIENHGRWDPHVVRIVPSTSGPLAAGSRFEIVRRTLGREETRVFEVTEWEQPARFTIATRSSDFDLTLASGVDESGPGRTRLTLMADARVTGGRALLVPVMRIKFAAELRRNLTQIKATVETEVALRPVPSL